MFPLPTRRTSGRRRPNIRIDPALERPYTPFPNTVAGGESNAAARSENAPREFRVVPGLRRAKRTQWPARLRRLGGRHAPSDLLGYPRENAGVRQGCCLSASIPRAPMRTASFTAKNFKNRSYASRPMLTRRRSDCSMSTFRRRQALDLRDIILARNPGLHVSCRTARLRTKNDLFSALKVFSQHADQSNHIYIGGHKDFNWFLDHFASIALAIALFTTIRHPHDIVISSH